MVVIAIFGNPAGLAAVRIAEISQGSIRTVVWLIQSWPNNAAFAILTGEPAVNVLPTCRSAAY
jgi:hypothetical protein